MQNESEQEYRSQDILHGGPNLSYHALAKFAKCPAAFRDARLGLIRNDDTDSYRIGRATHCRILEGRETYGSRYVFGGPINPKTGAPYGQRTKAYDEWRAEQEASGRECISDSDDMLIQLMAASVDAHAIASGMIHDGNAEYIVREKYCGTLCQSRLDYVTDRKLIDLKTCRNIDYFQDDFAQYKYANQLAFYRSMLEQLFNRLPDVYVIAVEKSEPYRCGVYHVSDEILTAAQVENEKHIRYLRECMYEEKWPTGFEDVVVIG